ncbi:alpha/beta hydrolase [Niabella beijingensis]|uniref:alpha/beta hydrolase n=1 Tax=Niabella beijingensis TaxID=2872700 RepID=UPI001CBCE6A6|nr:alpha/beta hydrolase [Niabella beijingensis]MBZ4191804.1 alpha/beta hydrolase [Niabella beijingensis]
MKRLLVLMILCAAFETQAQQDYGWEKDIAYYAASSEQDAYQQQQCRLDVYYPKNQKDATTVVWFHGGGLKAGKKEIPAALMNKGYIIVGVGYRFSPNVKAPQYIEDAAAAVAWVFEHIARYNGTRSKIILSGHSAGGYLDLMLTLDKKYLKRHQIDADSLLGAVPFSAQCITHFTVREERGMAPLQPVIDTLAPLYHVRKAIPSILLITGDREKELYGRYEENAYLQRMLKLAGNKQVPLYELQGFDHGGMAEPAFPLLLREAKRLSGL